MGTTIGLGLFDVDRASFMTPSIAALLGAVLVAAAEFQPARTGRRQRNPARGRPLAMSNDRRLNRPVV